MKRNKTKRQGNSKVPREEEFECACRQESGWELLEQATRDDSACGTMSRKDIFRVISNRTKDVLKQQSFAGCSPYNRISKQYFSDDSPYRERRMYQKPARFESTSGVRRDEETFEKIPGTLRREGNKLREKTNQEVVETLWSDVYSHPIRNGARIP